MEEKRPEFKDAPQGMPVKPPVPVPRKERRAIERQLRKLPPGEREGWLKKNGYTIR